MRIRHATVEDLEAIRAMTYEFLKEELEGGSHVKPGETTVGRLMVLQGAIIINQVPGAVLLAEDGEQAIGFTAFRVEGPLVDHRYERVATTFANYVMPERRRDGVASDLIAHKERLAKALGCSAMYTNVRLANEGCLKMVTDLGYLPQVVTLVKEI